MRALIISDLHLGNGGDYDVFAGEQELPALLDRFASPPTRVMVNGDGIDFLMNEDELALDVPRAVAQARSCAESRATKAVFAAFGRVLAAGGEVVIRLGNHDVELALPEVQEVFRSTLGQPPAVAARLWFQLGQVPDILDVGGARILLTHGEHNDPWNIVHYQGLSTAGAAERPSFAYAPGSILVKRYLNPLTREFGLRFVSLLKPDFQGGALTALAVAPAAMKLLFQRSSADLLWQLFRKMSGPAAFPADEEEQNLGLADRVAEAGLTLEEQEAVEALLGDRAVAFHDEEDDGALGRARLKLGRAGLKLYAKLQRKLTGKAGDTYFELEPNEAEWNEAKRLAAKFGASAVILGHTHAARWKHEDGLLFANTGTWIWLMQLPPSDAGDDVWAEFLAEVKQNPRLAAERQKVARLISRFTAVSIEEAPGGGADVALVEWDRASGIRTLGEARVPATS
ncbi:metallophosphoesterase [Sorangium sp. So ce1000]|uniref:metallophosphoesterase n=1 Tax=Sorangium sp. So ce1000 TaxID=3133325 RepID=UPI003F5E4D52